MLPICYFLMPPAQPDPGMTPVNINLVWGFNDRKPQTWMSPNAWFALLLFGLPVAVYWPTHLLLQYSLIAFARRPGSAELTRFNAPA